MTATIVQGTRTLNDVLSGRRKYYISDEITNIIKDPGIFARLVTATDFPKTQRSPVYEPVMKWNEQDEGVQSMAVASVDAASGVNQDITVSATNGKYIQLNSMLENENEHRTYRVTAAITGAFGSTLTEFTCKAADGETAAIEAADTMKILAPSISGTGTAGGPTGFKALERINAVQIMEFNIANGLFSANAKLLGGNQRDRDALTGLGELLRRMERTMLYGTYSADDTNSLYSTDGIYKQIYSNGSVTDSRSTLAPVAMTNELLRLAVNDAFAYDSDPSKVLVAGDEYIGGIMNLGLGKLQIKEDVKVYGINFTKINLMGKELLWYRHREMADSLGASVAGYKNASMTFNLNDLEIRYFPIDSKGRQMKGTDIILLKDIQDNNSLTREDQLIWVGGVNLKRAKTGSIHLGIKAA